MRPNPLADKIETMLTATLNGMGFGIVLVRLTEAHKRRTLQLFVERLDGRGISLDDCSEITQVASALLDVEDPITGAYNLEVSSPGIDRPLTKMADFARYVGHLARFDLAIPLQSRKRFTGAIIGTEGEDVQIRTPDNLEFFLPFGQMASAKLVLTDELIKAHAAVAAASRAEMTDDGLTMPAAVNDN